MVHHRSQCWAKLGKLHQTPPAFEKISTPTRTTPVEESVRDRERERKKNSVKSSWRGPHVGRINMAPSKRNSRQVASSALFFILLLIMNPFVRYQNEWTVWCPPTVTVVRYRGDVRPEGIDFSSTDAGGRCWGCDGGYPPEKMKIVFHELYVSGRFGTKSIHVPETTAEIDLNLMTLEHWFLHLFFVLLIKLSFLFVFIFNIELRSMNFTFLSVLERNPSVFQKPRQNWAPIWWHTLELGFLHLIFVLPIKVSFWFVFIQKMELCSMNFTFLVVLERNPSVFQKPR